MKKLAKQSCEPCRGDSPAVPESQWPLLLEQLPGWRVIWENGVPMLTRTFERKNFVKALKLANRIGDLAEAENHHPRLVVEYGRLNVAWWTHTISGLHHNDFIMAARCDKAV